MVAGELSVPEWQELDVDDEEVVVDRELLDTLSDRQLRVLAREIGLRTRRRNSGKRRTRGKLIDLLLKNADRLQVD